MANDQHLEILKQGVYAWNSWRMQNPGIHPDLNDAHLSGLVLRKMNFSEVSLGGVDLSFADITKSDFTLAELSEANLSNVVASDTIFTKANLRSASFRWAKLVGANLSETNLFRADLSEATLCNANLCGANLNQSLLIETDFENANLSGSQVFGVSAWELKLTNAIQSDLVVSRHGKPKITVDNLEVAQFMYLLLYNEKIRNVIDTITSKVVLILGNFSTERKQVLDTIRQNLRALNYLPVLFDFEKPSSRDLTETVSILARLSRFIIADITDPKSIPHELATVVPTLRHVPIAPILQSSQQEYSMFNDFGVYPWVLEIYRYKDINELIASLEQQVIALAESKIRQLT